MGRRKMETAVGSVLCVSALLAIALTQLAAGKIISCGGFIKSSVPGIDLSRVRVKLFTAQENLKYETECNPSTGYYMIPVYNKGKYRLQVVGPHGWIFDPDSQALEIVADDDDGPCADDINFQLSGFSITGKVRDTSGAGQADLSIALRSKSGGDSVDTIVTQADGGYEFKAPPGNYIVSIIDSGSGVQCVDRESVSVEVKNSPVSVKTDIHITGQNLLVTVRDETEVVVSGATLSLVSSRKLNFNNAADKGKPKETKEGPTSWVYSAHSNLDGVALFPCIPGGDYTIRGEWSSSDAKLNFAQKKVSTTGRSATSVTLAAESFDAISKLLTPTSGSGIGEAEILVDGQRAAVTDSEGRYVLKGLTAKSYRLEATKPQYEFASLEWDASSSVPVPRLAITTLSVCGKVEFGEKKVGHVRLRISDEGGKLIYTIDVSAQSGGKFCRKLPPGKYRLEAHGQTFAPTVLAVDLTDSPYLNAKFTQFQASIAGRVAMMGTSGVGLKLELLSDQQLLQEVRTIEDGKFQFDGVSPGIYKIRVVEDDGATLWWERAEQQMEIVDRSVADLVFRQSGYRARIDSTNAVHLKYSLASVTKHTELKVGSNDVFFPAKGQWKLEVVDSCHDFFTTADESLMHVPTKSTFQLIAKSSQLLVSIATESPATQPKFGITIQMLDGGDEKEKIVLDEAAKTVGKSSFTFAFHLNQANTGHRFSITPKSSEYLFSPTSFSFTFDGECGKNVANFKATIGKFIEGAVSPPVAGARVIARRKTAGESELESQGETDERGRYRLGPVCDTTGFVIDISKEGYEFERSSSTAPNLFKAVRLSQLRLNLRDEDGGKPLPGVLISLSGPNNYRSNVVVDKTGSFSFIGLAPGEYFVRPILLEYRFSSTSSSVVMKEGEVQELTLGAKRIAYRYSIVPQFSQSITIGEELSAFGRVTTLDGQRVQANVRVEAISTQCENHQEEDEFDGSKTSEFRIRGLKPECLYRVRVKEARSGEEEKVSKATTWSVYPPYANVQSDQIKDWHGISFVLTPAIANRYTVMGRVLFERISTSGTPPPSTTYTVELYRVGESTLLREVQLTSPGSAFVMPDLELVENESYSVDIRKSDSAKLKIQPLTSVFTANSSVIYLKLWAEKEKRSAELDSSKSSYLGFVVVILITVVFFSKQETLRSAAGGTADGVRTLLDRLRKQNAASEHERRLKRANKKNG